MVSGIQQTLDKYFWKERKKVKEQAYRTRPHNEHAIIMKLVIWRNPLVFHNDISVWLAVLVIHTAWC